MLLYACAIFTSAFLLFELQPIIARFVLPWFGGSAAVWTTCMLFFQAALVLGYLEGFITHRFLKPRLQGYLHATLLAASLLLLPIVPDPSWKPVGGAEPIGRILLLLLRSVGLPYVLLAATGPLLQSWFVTQYPGRNPYRLFALSNLASMLALLGYPLMVEPTWSSPQQARWWSWGYRGFVVLGILVALRRARRGAVATIPLDKGQDNIAAARDEVDCEDPGRAIEYGDKAPGSRVLWLLLPACASSLLLGVTNHLTQDVAAMPLLWIVPLCLYLLSFILCFEYPGAYRRSVFFPSLAVALAAMSYLRWPDGSRPGWWWQIAIYCVGLFVCCMVCHGELVRRKPHPARLTTFYLVIAMGGALGGIAVGLAAPLLLSSTFELELTMGVCAALALAALLVEESSRAAIALRPWLGIGAAGYTLGLWIFLAVSMGSALDDVHLAVRNFYGSLRVFEYGKVGTEDGFRKLLHGNINHGSQWLDGVHAREPTTYYCRDSGAGLALREHHADRPRKLGVVGLGAGTLAAYARPGDSLRYYEINPLVVGIAQSQFTYLRDSGADVKIVTGDARLSMEAEASQDFDVLLVDAFSGDAIPVHLLTREAFALYFRHLKSDGVLGVHISNRHLALAPVVADAAAAFGRHARLVDTSNDDETFCFGSSWVLLSATGELFLRPAFKDAEVLDPRPGFRAWTDEYSNLLSVLK